MLKLQVSDLPVTVILSRGPCRSAAGQWPPHHQVPNAPTDPSPCSAGAGSVLYVRVLEKIFDCKWQNFNNAI